MIIRKLCNGTGTEQQVTHYYPFGGIIADLSTGRNVQNRLYNGKDLDASNNLWWYDYGARQYDPTAPRFTTPDPLAEKYYGWNMYGYCLNNPISLVDPDGKDPTLAERVVIGAGVGFLIGGTIAIIQNKSAREVFGSAVEGAVIGGTIGATGNIKFAEKWGATARVATESAIGAVSSAVGNIANQTISTGSIDLNETADATLSGAVVGGTTSAGSHVIQGGSTKIEQSISTSANTAKTNVRQEVVSQSRNRGGHSSRTQTNKEVARRTRSVEKNAATQVRIVSKTATATNYLQQGLLNTMATQTNVFPYSFSK